MRSLTLAALLAIAAFFPAPSAQAVGSDLPYGTCHQAEALDAEVITACTIGVANGASTGGITGAADATSGGWCPGPGTWRFQWGASYNKWTPLYGANSPRLGYSQLTLESSDSSGLNVGFTWNGFNAKLSAEHTVSEGVSLRSDNGVSKVKYQWITWSDADIDACGWDWHWHDAYNTYVPTNYEPTGYPIRKVGQLENASTTSDEDNRLKPTFAVPAQAISADLRYKNLEADECFSNEDKWFGEEDVYSVEASMDFGGVIQVGATRTHTEKSTFLYHFDDGCYYIDVLGSDPQDSGLAFKLYQWSNGGGGGGGCATDTPAGAFATCADPCDMLNGVTLVAYVDPCDPPEPCDNAATLTTAAIDPCDPPEPCDNAATLTTAAIDPCDPPEPCDNAATLTTAAIDPCDPPEPCDGAATLTTAAIDPCDPPEPCEGAATLTTAAIDPCDPVEPIDPCDGQALSTANAVDPCDPPPVDPCGRARWTTAIDPCDPGPVIIPDPCGAAPSAATADTASLLEQLVAFLCGGGRPPLEGVDILLPEARTPAQ